MPIILIHHRLSLSITHLLYPSCKTGSKGRGSYASLAFRRSIGHLEVVSLIKSVVSASDPLSDPLVAIFVIEGVCRDARVGFQLEFQLIQLALLFEVLSSA